MKICNVLLIYTLDSGGEQSQLYINLSFQNPNFYPSSNASQQMEQASQNLTVSNTEDIITSSQKPKKGKLYDLTTAK